MNWDHIIDPYVDGAWVRATERVEDMSDADVLKHVARRCPGSYEMAMEALRASLAEALYDEAKYGTE